MFLAHKQNLGLKMIKITITMGLECKRDTEGFNRRGNDTRW
jgi:hypothetical protein